MVSLIYCELELSAEQEPKRKEVHDKILQDIGINQKKEFEWGKISSEYEVKSNISSINIIYF